jgi:hypothetical protein
MATQNRIPKMSRFAYEQLPESQRYPFPNADGTVTIERLGHQDLTYRVDVELTEAPLFPLGQIVATTALIAELTEVDIGEESLGDLLRRHVGGDWGELYEEDHAENDDALVAGNRILSSYCLGPVRVWAITEWDRSVTTLLRPDDY